MNGLRQVSKEEFYAFMMRRDMNVHPHIVTSYPYTQDWELIPSRTLVGKSVERYANPPAMYPMITDYYLAIDVTGGAE